MNLSGEYVDNFRPLERKIIGFIKNVNKLFLLFINFMLLSLFLFILSAILLFLSSQSLLSRLYRILPLNLLFFLLLPGIFLHEFSHILMAELLRVKTGELKLKPEFENGHLTLGSAQIALTDPFRLTLIGTAPFLTGILSLWLLLQFGLNLNFAHLTLPASFAWWQALFIYLIFAVSNTLFSSPSDLQSASIPLVLLLIILGAFKLANLNLPPTFIPYLSNFFLTLAIIFFISLAINLILLLPFKLFRKH